MQSRCLLLLVTCVAASAQVDVLTFHNDSQRTGQNLKETLLTPADVNARSFGKLFNLMVDGKVDAQPLYVSQLQAAGSVHNAVLIATEHASVYAFDADTGQKLWQASLLKSGETPSDNRSCGQVTPEIGVTSTPVIAITDGASLSGRGRTGYVRGGTMYVVGMSKDASGGYHQRLHALVLETGAELPGSPVDAAATYGKATFDPKQYKARPGLLLMNGKVYVGWSSHCDINPYSAWLMAYDARTLKQTAVLNMTPTGSEGSIWQSGAGLAADGAGNVYFLLANGTFDTTLDANGFPQSGNYGNAFMKVSTASGKLAVADYFTESNQAAENATDEDLGSGGALVLPEMKDVNGITRRLAVGAGKDRNIYVVNRDSMGKYNGSSNNIWQELPAALAGGEFAMPAYFHGTLYYGGSGDAIKAFTFTAAKLAGSPGSQTANVFPYPGATPAISAAGAMNGIVWAAENSSSAVLHAYDAANLATQLYASDTPRDYVGAGNKYIAPMIANGKVFLATTDSVGVFGLLNCEYHVTGATAVSAAGGTGTLTVTTGAGCSWSALADSAFVTITGGSTGTGTGTVTYAVSANANGSSPRRHGVLVAGQVIGIEQGTAGRAR